MIPQWVVILVLVLVALALIYLHASQDPCLRQKIASSLGKSCGAFDESALEALEANLKLSRPRTRDHYTRGKILQHWVAENDPAHPAMTQAAEAYAAAAQGARAEFLAGDIDLADTLMLEELYFAAPAMLTHGADYDNHLATPAIDQAVARTRQQALEKSLETATTKLEAASSTLSAAKTYRDDPQNVHDSSVVSDLADTYAKIRIPDGPQRASRIDSFIESLENYAIKRGAPKETLELIHRVKASQDQPISSYADTEKAILASVFARADNNANRNISKKAVLGSLEDCYESGGLVCTGGRAARYLSSLAGIDSDPSLGHAGSYDAYKNQIYGEAMNIIRIHSAAGTPAANEYAGIDVPGTINNNSSREPTAREKQEFASELRAALVSHVAGYSDKLTPIQIQKLTDDCIVYAML